MNCPPRMHNPFFSCSCPEKNSQYVSEHRAWADKIFRRFTNLRSDYRKLAQGQQRKKSGQLTALQKWKLEHLSYLKPYYKQSQKARKEFQGTGVIGGPVQTPTDHESDDEHEHEDIGHESSSSATRNETPKNIPVLSSPLPMCKPLKKRSRDTEKEEKASHGPHFNELMDVMKELASHLVSQRTRSANIHDRERESFAWLNDFTSRMPRQNWRDFQKRTVNLAMEFMPAESPQPNTARPRIQQGASTSHVRHPMDPPPRPATSSSSYVEMLQSQQYGGGPNPLQMVSNFLLYVLKKFLL